MEHQADVHPQLRLILPDAGPGCEKNGRSATWAVTTRSGRHQVPVAVLPTAKSLSAFSLKPQSDRLLESRSLWIGHRRRQDERRLRLRRPYNTRSRRRPNLDRRRERRKPLANGGRRRRGGGGAPWARGGRTGRLWAGW